MITRSMSKKQLEYNKDSVETSCTPHKKQRKSAQKRITLVKASKNDNENDKLQSSILNIHIHLPSLNENIHTSPLIQPIIQLNFDDIFKSIPSGEVISTKNAANTDPVSKSLQNLLFRGSPQLGSVTVDYKNYSNSSPVKNETLERFAVEQYNDSENAEISIENNLVLSDKVNLDKLKKFKLSKNNVKKKSSMVQNDKDFESDFPVLEKQCENLVKDYLKKSRLGSKEIDEKCINSQMPKKCSKVRNYVYDKNTIKLKKAIVLLEDINYKKNLTITKCYNDKKNQNYHTSNKPINCCLNKIKLKTGAKYYKNEGKNNIGIDSNRKLVASVSENTDKEKNIHLEADYCENGFNENVKMNKKKEIVKKTVESTDRDFEITSSLLQSLDNEHEDFLNILKKASPLIDPPNCSLNSNKSKDVSNEKNDSINKTSLKCNNKQFSKTLKTFENVCETNGKNIIKDKEIATVNEMLLSRKNSEFSVASKDDKNEFVIKEKSLTSLVEGCNFSEILKKIQNENLRKKIVSFANFHKNIAQTKNCKTNCKTLNYGNQTLESEKKTENNDAAGLFQEQKICSRKHSNIKHNSHKNKIRMLKEVKDLGSSNEIKLIPKFSFRCGRIKFKKNTSKCNNPIFSALMDSKETKEMTMSNTNFSSAFFKSQSTNQSILANSGKKIFKKTFNSKQKVEEYINKCSSENLPSTEHENKLLELNKTKLIGLHALKLQFGEMRKKMLKRREDENEDISNSVKKRKCEDTSEKQKKSKSDINFQSLSPSSREINLSNKKLLNSPKSKALKTNTSTEESYIPLHVSGSTKFAVAALDKVKAYQNHDVLTFKEKMLFGNRIKRFSGSSDLHIYKLKQQTARSKI